MKRSTSWIAVLPSLVIPICIGLMMYLGLTYLINQGTISNELVLRYLTGHPVSEVTIGMFFVGIASLGLIAKNIFEQFGAERKITLNESDSTRDLSVTSNDDSETNSETGDRAIVLEKRLQELPGWMEDHYLWQRLVNALHSIDRTNSSSGVEDELKYLADLDLERQQQRYSLVRILIWATPMLGFLGTVLGISQALGGINVGPDNNFQQMMDGLRGSLYIAFDTTALALTLSIILMFGQFLIERFESQLLVLVDQRSKSEIAVQFDMTVSETTGYEDFANQILDASRESTEKQTEIWRKSIRAAEQAWVSSLTQVNAQVQGGLTHALDENVSNLAHYLGEAIERADTAMSHRWEQWQVTLSDNARIMESHQRLLCEQTAFVHQLLTESKGQQNIPSRDVQKQNGDAPPIPRYQPAPDKQVVGHGGSNSIVPKTIRESQLAVHNVQPVSKVAETTTARAADVSFDSSRRNPEWREPIRFDNYHETKPQSFASKPTGEVGAEVILPFRPVTKRSMGRASANHRSKKSA